MGEEQVISEVDGESVAVMTWSDQGFRLQNPPFDGVPFRFLTVTTPARATSPSAVELVTRLQPVLVNVIGSEGKPVAVHMFRMKRDDGGRNLAALCIACGALAILNEGHKAQLSDACPKCKARASNASSCVRWHAWGDCWICDPNHLGPLAHVGEARQELERGQVGDMAAAGPGGTLMSSPN